MKAEKEEGKEEEKWEEQEEVRIWRGIFETRSLKKFYNKRVMSEFLTLLHKINRCVTNK